MRSHQMISMASDHFVAPFRLLSKIRVSCRHATVTVLLIVVGPCLTACSTDVAAVSKRIEEIACPVGWPAYTGQLRHHPAQEL